MIIRVSPDWDISVGCRYNGRYVTVRDVIEAIYADLQQVLTSHDNTFQGRSGQGNSRHRRIALLGKMCIWSGLVREPAELCDGNQIIGRGDGYVYGGVWCLKLRKT